MCILVLEVQGEQPRLGLNQSGAREARRANRAKRLEIVFFVKMKVLLGLNYTLDFTEKMEGKKD